MYKLARINLISRLLLLSLLSLPATGRESLSPPDNSANGHTVTSTSCDGKLNILLSNDDGFDQPGIVALQKALSRAGHRVVIAAPAKNASGSSASITFAPVTVKQLEKGVYAIDASPASAVILAVSALLPPDNPPDLLISGINKGANLGPATGISGTVGATTAALQILNPPIPAIAISTDPLGSNFSPQQKREHLQGIAALITSLVDKLQPEPCKKDLLLPKGLALNINYPPLAPEKIKGIVMKEQGYAPYFTITYTPSKDLDSKDQSSKGSDSKSNTNVFLPVFKTQALGNDIASSDTVAYHNGYITIVALDGNYTSKAPAVKAVIEPLILTLTP